MDNLIDVSLGIGPDLPVWPGDPAIDIKRESSIDDGDDANVSRLELGSHTGTHVDAPLHFLPGGSSVEDLPLDALMGECTVVGATGAEDVVGAEHLTAVDPVDRVLLKTTNSDIWASRDPSFTEDYVAPDAGAADWLAERGALLVGIDFLSIEPFGSEDFPVHKRLLDAGIVIVEGLDLSSVAPGRYEMACLPLKLLGGDGAPARCVLRPL